MAAHDGTHALPAAVSETHASTLLFVDDRVYKRKKPLDLGFLDFRDRTARRAACENEVALNRRLAPDVYLGVGELRQPDDEAAGGEPLVVMRRMPDDRRLATLVQHGSVEEPDIRRLARTLADFHRGCTTSPAISAYGSIDAVGALWESGLDALDALHAVRSETIQRIRELARRYLAGRHRLFEARIAAGRIRDGHGDLLAEDIFLLDDGPRILDCLEFDPALRAGDVLGDASFLAMDLERLGAPALAGAFLDEWRTAYGDDAPASLEHHFLAYRAQVRAKVHAIRWEQNADPAELTTANDHAQLCLEHLERGRCRAVLVGGVPGTGKSTVARHLSHEHGWALLHSDAVRRELFGTTTADGPDTGSYAPELVARVYDELLRRAGALLAMGETVVLDASWTNGAQREHARAMADRHHADVVELTLQVPGEVADARLLERRNDLSDATPGVRAVLADRADEWPEAHVVRTDRSIDLTLAEAERAVALS